MCFGGKFRPPERVGRTPFPACMQGLVPFGDRPFLRVVGAALVRYGIAARKQAHPVAPGAVGRRRGACRNCRTSLHVPRIVSRARVIPLFCPEKRANPVPMLACD